MKSKIVLTTSFICFGFLCGCLDEVTEAPDLSSIACTTEPLDDDSGVKIVCGGDSVGVVHNGKDGRDGKDGKNGKDGANGQDGKNGKDGVKGDKGENGSPGQKGDTGSKGENGSSCSIVENKEINGYDVICGNEKVGELKNGNDGVKGENGDKGATGKSAYEAAVSKGFTGTEEEWLASLKGDAGTSCSIQENKEKDGYDLNCGGKIVTITNGENGKTGKEGKSAFEIAQEKNTNLESVDEWLASLKGDDCKGQQLANGNIKITCGSSFEAELEKGHDGANCTVKERTDGTGYDLDCNGDVVTVKNGEDGKEGKSAFDIAKEKDPNLTVDEWLDALKGDNCKGEKLSNGNIKITCGTNFEEILEKGNDGANCTVDERTDGTGYDLNCGGNVVTVKNGDPGKEGKSAFDIAKEKDPNLTEDEWLASLKGEGCTAKEVENGVEITCGNGTPVIIKNGESATNKVEVLSDACKTLRSTTDKFIPIFDIFYCLRSNEKVTFILRHAARGDDTSESGTLSQTGENQCKEVGSKLKEMNLEDFSYMHTRFYRAKQTAWIIAKNKGQDVGNQNAWFNSDDTEIQITNDDLLDGWYVQNKDDNLKKTCKGKVSSGWGAYSRAAYKEYDSNDQKTACDEFLYDIDQKTQEIIKKHFTYDKMKPGVTLAISHDQFLAPFVISISNRQIKGSNGRDLRYHEYGTQEHWINYLSGVAIITDPDDNTKIIPTTALSSGFLQ